MVREGPHAWRVQGRPAERAVALADLTHPDAIAYIQQTAAAHGRRAGAGARPARADGDVVRIGDDELTYEEPRSEPHRSRS